MCGVRSITARASLTGFRTLLTSVQAPHFRPSLLMTLASISTLPLAVKTVPRPVRDTRKQEHRAV